MNTTTSGAFARLRLLMAMALAATTAIVFAPFSPTPVAGAAGPATDDFSSGDYNGGSGWSGAWNESGDDGSASGGTIRITGGALEFDNIDNASISRDIDLTGYADGSTLSFTLVDEQVDGADESIVFEIDPDGPTSWQTIATSPNSPDGTRLTYVIPSAALVDGVAEFRIRSGGDNSWQSGDEIGIDDIEFAHYLPNPDLDASCGIDVDVILDESGSINSSNAVDEVEDAMSALAQGLAGTTSSIRLVEFSTNGRDAQIGGSTALRPVDAGYLSDLDTYLGGTGDSGDPATYSPTDFTGDGENFTNWEAGLDRAQPNNADLVVFITDGVPNTVGTSGNSQQSNGGGSDASAAAAFEEAQAIRAANTKLIGIGVGQVTAGSNLGRLEQIVEPNNPQTWNGTGPLDISTIDVMQVDEFEDLDDALRQVVFALCSPSVSITKVDQNGDSVSGLDFDGTVQINEVGQSADDFEWVSPVTGTAVAPDNLGVTQTDTTNGSGSVLFQWVPNTVDDPEVWASSFTFTESLTGDFAGWSLPATQPDCSVERLVSNPAPGAPITDTFAIQLVADGPDQAGTVTFSLERNELPFVIQKADIVRCQQVVNLEPATITIEKDVDNDGPDDDMFGFTGDLGSFDLDDTGSDSETFSVVPGEYTVTENDPTSLSYVLSGISCADVTGSAGGAPDLSNRSVEIDVSAGSSITCTFLNTEVPEPELTVTKNPSPAEFPEQDGSVTYTVTITNPNGADNPIEITSITDSATLNGGSPVGVVLGTTPAPSFPQPYPGGQVVSSDCQSLIDTEVGDSSVDCAFTVDFTDRNADDDIDDTITVSGTDELDRPIQRTASAEVDVTPVPPSIIVDKQNLANESVVAPGGTASYTVKVTNDGSVENVTLTGVTDVVTVGGSTIATPDLTSNDAPLVSNTCTDLIGTVLAPGEFYACEFAITVSGLAQDDALVNTVTVTGRDDDPTPQTTSDDDPAERTVLGEPPALSVSKTDNDATITEPGENIVYDIDITNQSTTEAVTVTKITDEVYFTPDGGARVLAGTLVVTSGSVVFTEANASGVTLVGTTCDTADADGGVGSVLAASGTAGDTTSCSITLNLPGNAGDEYDDKVIVEGEDETGDPVSAENTDATPVVNVAPAVLVTKTADPAAVPEYGPEGDRTVTFTVVVENTSVSSDPLTITSLNDSDFGDLLTDAGNGIITSNTCDDVLTGLTLPSGASSDPCTFTAVLSGTVANPHNNVVTVQGADDEGNTATDDDDATVDFTDVLPTIDVVKTAIDPVDKTVSEFGGDVTYQVGVTNTSGEPVLVTSLTDDKFGDLTLLAESDCAVTDGDFDADGNDGLALDPGETYTCTFTAFVAQDQVNTPPASASHVNVVTATAVDDEQNVASDFDDETVGFTPVPPQIDVTKTDDDLTLPEPGGLAEYDITITNPADADENIVSITALTDEVTFNDPADVITYDLLGSVPDGRLTASNCAANIAAALPLVPGDSVDCSFTLDLSGLTAQAISDLVAVTGVDNDGQSADDDATEETPITDVAPAVQIVKTANPSFIDDGESTTYSFEITNLSAIEPLFVVDLDDDRFDDLSGLTPADQCTFSVEAPVELAPNGEAGDSITCTGTFTPIFGEAGFDDAPGTHTNVATVSAADDEILKNLGGESEKPFVTDDDDATVTALSDVTTSKTVDDALTGFADGVWTVVYDITVANGSAGTDTYSIDDELGYGAGTQVETVTAVVVSNGGQDDGPGTADLNPTFQPDPNGSDFDGELISDMPIDGNTTHQYRVTVTASVPTPTVGAGECDVDSGTAGGFLNTATVTVGDEERDPDRACEPFNTLTLIKNLINDDGGEAGYDVFPMTATPSDGGDALVEGTNEVVAAIPSGDYDLAEPAAEGYTSSGWTCTVGDEELVVDNGTATTGSISIDGENAVDVRCEITNDDDPVDLELTKSDGGATAVAGGDPFPYTITVENVGTRAVDADGDDADAVTVVDVLPVGFEWVTFPSNPLDLPACAIDGSDPSVLRCDVDPADLGVGEQVVINTTVQALPDTPGGTYTNVAWVSTDDDPVCNPQAQDCDPTCEESCTPPPCPDGDVPGSNVGCDDTPLVHEGELEIVKTADVVTAVNGDTFDYDISVSNTGPSPITDVVVTDDLPDGLTLESVSVNAAHWTCNAADPVSCSYNTPLAAGPAASPITITVTVDDDAVFADDTIVNVAVVNGDLDDEPLPPVDDDAETPLERTPASADLVIDKSASVSTIAVGDGDGAETFDWTLEVVNDGPDPAVDVVVNDIVPSTLSITDVSSTYFDCSTSGQTVTCTRDTMPVGASGTVTISVSLPDSAAAGSIENVGTVESDVPDPDLSNNSDDATVDVVAQQPPVTQAPPPVTLPPTGSNGTSPMLQIGLLLLAVGVLGVVGARRRRGGAIA